MIRGNIQIASIKKLFNQIPPALLAVFVCVSLVLCGCGTTEKKDPITDNAVSGDQIVSGDGVDNAEETSKIISEEKGIINFYGNQEMIPGLDALISDFNEYYPNVEVEYTDLTADFHSTSSDGASDKVEDEINEEYDEITSEEYAARYRLAIENACENGTVDLFISDKILFENSETVKNNTVDIDDTDIDRSAIDPGLLRQCESEDVCFSVPLYANVSGLLVNKTVLDLYDLEVPTEYFEFITDCSVLKSEGICAIAGDSNMFVELLRDQLAAGLVENGNVNEAVLSLNNAEETAGDYLTETIEVLKFLKTKRYFDLKLMPDISDRDSSVKCFESGGIVFMPTDYMTAHCVSTDNIEYSFIPMPLGADGANVCARSAVSLSLNNNAPNRRWAETFLGFLSSADELNMIAGEAGAVSAAARFPDEYFDGDVSGVTIYDYPGLDERVIDIFGYVLTEVSNGHHTVSSAVKLFDTENKSSLKAYRRALKGKKVRKDKRSDSVYESGNVPGIDNVNDTGDDTGTGSKNDSGDDTGAGSSVKSGGVSETDSGYESGNEPKN